MTTGMSWMLQSFVDNLDLTMEVGMCKYILSNSLSINISAATTFMVASSHSEGQFVLDDVHCNGSEDSLLDCRSTLFFHDCIAGEEAGVRCYNGE